MFRKLLESLYAKLTEKAQTKIILVDDETAEYENIAEAMQKFEKDAVLNKLLTLEKKVADLNTKLVLVAEKEKNLREQVQYCNSTVEELLNLVGGEIIEQDEDEDGGEPRTLGGKLNIN